MDIVHAGSLRRVCLRLSAVAVVLVLPAGCAELHWLKAGVDPAALDEDLQRCVQAARLEARQRELPAGFGSPLAIRADPEGRPVVVPTTTRDTERFLLERDLTGACMRSKGYELVPAGNGVKGDK